MNNYPSVQPIQYQAMPLQQPNMQYQAMPPQQPNMQYRQMPPQQPNMQYQAMPPQQPNMQYQAMPLQQPNMQYQAMPLQQPNMQYQAMPPQQPNIQYRQMPLQQPNMQHQCNCGEHHYYSTQTSTELIQLLNKSLNKNITFDVQNPDLYNNAMYIAAVYVENLFGLQLFDKQSIFNMYCESLIHNQFSDTLMMNETMLCNLNNRLVDIIQCVQDNWKNYCTNILSNQKDVIYNITDEQLDGAYALIISYDYIGIKEKLFNAIEPVQCNKFLKCYLFNMLLPYHIYNEIDLIVNSKEYRNLFISSTVNHKEYSLNIFFNLLDTMVCNIISHCIKGIKNIKFNSQEYVSNSQHLGGMD